jgi:membrane protease YdiL (CAAX protease family)
VVWGVVALLFLSGIEVALVAPFDPDLKSLASKLVAQLLLAVTLTGVAFGFATLPKSGVASPEVLGLRRFKLSDLKWAAAAVGIYFVFAAVYAPLVQPHQEDVARDLGFGSSVFGAIAAGLLIIVVSPISEEIFFRGFVFGGLRHRWSFWPSALLAGVVFGIFHFTGVGSLGVVPQLAVLGAILCWLYEKTGSIGPTITVHMLNNTLAFIVIATS